MLFSNSTKLFTAIFAFTLSSFPVLSYKALKYAGSSGALAVIITGKRVSWTYCYSIFSNFLQGYINKSIIKFNLGRKPVPTTEVAAAVAQKFLQ
jgi:hypothetical protein